jgi:carboxylate-amine ligase
VGSEPSFTIGVEEEYLIVDAETLELRPRGETVMDAARDRLGDQVQYELNLSQIEVGTRVCRTLDDVRRELVRLRREVTAAAQASGSNVVSGGTHPFTAWLGQAITPKERYVEMAEEYGLTAWQQLICGCHVHIGLEDAEEVIRVMDRCRPWLPTLLALSANSPFWEGIDTGYASYRLQLWERWPMTGTADVFGSRAGYDELVEALLATGSISEPTKLYWDVRPSVRFPTVELRIADVCPSVDDATMIAGLGRSLVRSCLGRPRSRHPRGELVRAARWRAARYGLDGELIDVDACESRPAPEVVGALLAFLRTDLEDHGEWDEVSGLVERTLAQGNGARRQREVYRRTGSLRAVVKWLLEETLRD